MLPCSLKLKLQPAVLSPQRPVTSLPVYFAFFKFFSFMHLRTLPSSVSRKSFPCHSYENCRVRTNDSQSGTLRVRGTRPCRNPSILHFRLCELCVLRRLCVNSGLSSLATVHGSLSAFSYPLSFQILADSFALIKITTLLFSIDSKLFAQNTRGGVYIPVALVSHWPELANRPGRLSSNASFFNFQLSTVNLLRAVLLMSATSAILEAQKRETTLHGGYETPHERGNPRHESRNRQRAHR